MSGMAISLGRVGQIQSTIGQFSQRQVSTVRPTSADTVTSMGVPSAGRAETGALFARALSAVAPTLPVPTLPVTPSLPFTAPETTPAAGATSANRGASLASAPDAGKGSLVDDGVTTGSDVVSTARKYLGIPYVWGGSDTSGLDCSGLVQLVFDDLGISMPRVTYDQMREGTEIPSLAQARAGDLILTRDAAHIGIYMGDNKVLHAPRPGKNVEISDLNKTDAEITSIRRIVPADGGTDLVAAAQAAAVTGRP